MVVNPFPIWLEVIDTVQITLGGSTCIFVVTQFVRESHQMYKATKQFQLNHYMNLLVREGMIYFFAYVHISSFHPFPLPRY